MKINVLTLFLFLGYCLVSCTGPRNIYSSSPLVSPVPLEKGAAAIEVNYFAHTRQNNVRDSIPGNRDNCFGVTFSKMLKDRVLAFTFADLKREHNQFNDSTRDRNNFDYNDFNAGFDSSVVSGKRYTMGGGIEFFSNTEERVIRSLAVSSAFHHFSLNDSGFLLGTPYRRFYKVDQLTFSIQGNLLFRISDRFNLAAVTRLTILHSFRAHTDYSADEKLNAGLRDKRATVFVSLLPTLYADYRLLRKTPLYISSQFFNDLTLWEHTFTEYEPGRIYMKGTGASLGIKYVFQ